MATVYKLDFYLCPYGTNSSALCGVNHTEYVIVNSKRDLDKYINNKKDKFKNYFRKVDKAYDDISKFSLSFDYISQQAGVIARKLTSKVI